MTLSEALSHYDEAYWDFAEYREKSTMSKYPAIMVAPMQEKLLQEILQHDSDIHEILDPFMGSGTVLSIGKKLGLKVIGYDINPFASLITRVRLEGVSSTKILRSNDELKTRLALFYGNAPLHSFPNIEKWFRNDVIKSLSTIRASILGEHDISIRRFYWCCFAEVIKKYSNTRTSTFKLHAKEASKIAGMTDDSIDCFRNIAQKFSTEYAGDGNDDGVVIRTGDACELLGNENENSIDLICTSPPYGDNHTTVTYGQYSILPLLWIDSADLDPFDKKLVDNFSAIDTASLGGQIPRNMKLDDYKEFLQGISPSKQKKVASFFRDYELVFAGMARALKANKLMVLTLGNRRVDNQILPFDAFNDYLAEKYGLDFVSTLIRNICGKRMPMKVSSVENHAVVSMNKEYIKIYRKADTNE